MTPRPITHGTLLAGRYRTSGVLGVGGMGQVLEAVDERLGRPVAVKLVTTTDPTAADRLRAEATVLARLRHPCIVTVFDVGEHDGRPFVVTELVRGRSLGERLSEHRPADPAWVATMGAQIASALACAHEHGVVHRDLKPGNILLAEPDGNARLIDFGIAVSESALALTSTGLVIGTPAYLSPEQVEGRRATPPSDVYALGLVLVEAIRGERLFPGTAVESTAARLHADAPIPSDLPAGWTELLRSMTRLDPARRPTADEVATRLRRLAPGLAGEQVGAATADRASTTTMAATTMGATTTAATPSGNPGRAPLPAPDPGAPTTSAVPIVPAGRPAYVDPSGAADPPRRRRLGARVPVLLAVAAFVAALVVVGALVVGDGPASVAPTPSTDAVQTDTSPSTMPSTPTTSTATTATAVTTSTAPAPPTTAGAPGPAGGQGPTKGQPGGKGKGKDG